MGKNVYYMGDKEEKSEDDDNDKGLRLLKITGSLAVVVLAMIYLYERVLQNEHMGDVFLVILIFGVALIYMYSVMK